MADRPVQFGPKAAEQIKATVIRVNRDPYAFAPQRPSKYPIIAGIGVQIVDAVVTNSITAFNSNTNTYGSGTAQAVWATFNTNTNSYTSTNNNTIGNVTVYMTYKNNSSTIATNTRIKMNQQQANGGSLIWEFLGSDC